MANASGTFSTNIANDTTNQTTTDTTTTYDQRQFTAALGPQGANSNGFSLLDSNIAGGVVLNQESPTAIAALQHVADTALDNVSAVSGTASEVARMAASKAFDLAGANSGTAASQTGKMILTVGLIAVALAGLYFFRRK